MSLFFSSAARRRLQRIAAVLILLAGPGVRAADILVTATITVQTNPAGLGTNLTINGSTYTWTNDPSASPATLIQATNNTRNAATNLVTHLGLHPPDAGWYFSQTTPTNVTLRARPAQAITVTFAGAWASVSYATQLVNTPTITVRVPLSSEPALTNRTNIASWLVDGLNTYSTTALATNSTALSNAVIAGAMPLQRIISPKQFDGGVGIAKGGITNVYITGASNLSGRVGALTNGYWTNAVLDGPKLTNAVAFGSIVGRTATGAPFLGTNVTTTGVGSGMMAGVNIASSDQGTFYGVNISNEGETTAGFGSDITFSGAGSGGSLAYGTAIAISGFNCGAFGNSITLTHDRVFAFGNSIGSTEERQFIFGDGSYSVLFGGRVIMAEGATNFQTLGDSTNILRGTVALVPGTYTGVSSAGAHNILRPGSNVIVRVTGAPSAAFDVGGIDGNDQTGDLAIHVNETGYDGTIWSNDGSITAANRITTLTGTNMPWPAGSALFTYYNAASSRHVMLFPPQTIVTASATNAPSNLNGAATNLAVFQTAGNAALTVNALPGAGTNALVVLSSNAQPVFGVTSNGTAYARGWTGTTNEPFRVESTNRSTVFGVDSNGTAFARAVTGSTSDLIQFQTTNGAVPAFIRSNHTAVFSNLSITPITMASGGNEVGVPYRLFAITNDVIVTNVTVSTGIISNHWGTDTLPANWWTPGKSIELRLRGRYFSGAGTISCTNAFTFGGVVLATNLIALNATSAGDVWYTDVTITCRSVGASGTLIANGMTWIPSAAGGTSSVGRRIAWAAGAVTVDTTAAGAVGVLFHPNATTTALHIQNATGLAIP